MSMPARHDLNAHSRSAAAEQDGPPIDAGAAQDSRTHSVSPWRVSGTVGVMAIVALIALFGETAASIVRIWQNSSTFAHGWLIVPICAWVAWQRRARLAALDPSPSAWGLAALAAAALGWFVGAAADVQVVQQFALAAMIQAMVLTVLGPRVFRALLFPLGYLYFAVPAGEFLVPPMQDWTAEFVVLALRTIGVPVFHDGVFISIPTGNFEVAEACAGVRFLISMLALGVLWAYLTYRSWPRRLLFVGLSFAVPVVANWVRAFGIVLVAYLTDNEVAVGVDHIVYGWLFFVIVILLMFALGLTFRESHAGAATTGETATTVAAAANGRRNVWRSAGYAGAALLIAASAFGYHAHLRSRAPAPVNASPDLVVSAPWRAADAPAATWAPVFPGADAVVLRSFSNGERQVSLAIGYYSVQRQGAEAVSSAMALADGEVWVRTRSGRALATVDGEPMSVAYHWYRAGDWERLVWYWYWVDGEFTARPHVAKLLQARAAVLGGPDEAAVVAASIITGGIAAGEADKAALRDFVAALDGLAAVLEDMSASR